MVRSDLAGYREQVFPENLGTLNAAYDKSSGMRYELACVGRQLGDRREIRDTFVTQDQIFGDTQDETGRYQWFEGFVFGSESGSVAYFSLGLRIDQRLMAQNWTGPVQLIYLELQNQEMLRILLPDSQLF